MRAQGSFTNYYFYKLLHGAKTRLLHGQLQASKAELSLDSPPVSQYV